jgi:hypothetical protein
VLGRLRGRVLLLFVHVSHPGERLYDRPHERADPNYQTDPTSMPSLEQVAAEAGGQAFAEDQIGDTASAARAAVGNHGATATLTADRRVALAPWFVLAGVLPLGFLLWRRNA